METYARSRVTFEIISHSSIATWVPSKSLDKLISHDTICVLDKIHVMGLAGETAALQLPRELTELRLPKNWPTVALRPMMETLPNLMVLGCQETGFYPTANLSSIQVIGPCPSILPQLFSCATLPCSHFPCSIILMV